MTKPIDDSDYQSVMDTVLLAASVTAGIPFERLLATIERTHSLGPILFPSDYRDAGKSLDAQRRLLEAGKAFRDCHAKLLEEFGGEQ